MNIQLIKIGKIIFFTTLLIFVFTTFTYAQRFLILSNNPIIEQNIKKGDSCFFEKDYHGSLAHYKKATDLKYDELIDLNQIQNYIANDQLDSGLDVLRTMADSGFYKIWIINKEPQFNKLKSLAGFIAITTKLENNFDKYARYNHIKRPAITRELMWFFYMDQYYQWQNSFKSRYKNAYSNFSSKQIDSLMSKEFHKNVKRIKKIIFKHGYLWNSDIGKEATHVIWIILQHADFDRSFQEEYLVQLKRAVDRNDASPQDLAYLTDRVRKGKGEKQLYGTQMTYKTIIDSTGQKSIKTELWPVENPEDLDKRRKAVGLLPITQYLELMKKLNNHN